MKSKVYIYAVSAFLILTAMIACSKFLDKKTSNGLSTPNSLKTLQALLDNSDVFNISVAPSYGEASADNYFITDADYSKLSDQSKNAYRWAPVTYNYSNEWAKCYTTVYYANLCLEALGKIPATPENRSDWEYIKGASLFHRAYAFLNLAWTFAKAYDKITAATDLGIDLRLQSDYTVPSKRSSVAAVYSRILEDLSEAITYLPANTAHVLRPGKAAGMALMARAYLSMRNYDSAFKYADESLKLNPYLIDYNAINNAVLPFAALAYTPEVLFYSTVYPGDVMPSKRVMIDTILYRMYKTGDMRKILFFDPNGMYYNFKGTYSTNVGLVFSGITTAEMYLVKGECLVRMGKIKEGLDQLNTLLRKRGSPVILAPEDVGTEAEALQIILEERRKELIMRGVRWSDIKRLNKEGAGILLQRLINGALVTLPANDNRYALPLPQDILIRTGMEQN
ncbi:RagB/SusD family nutrient uptake outer membrane protein [Niabella sp. CC-SYL272]|uniref:RagB/SusD family nutrient uptake outer membrane protein n=1 Tax=Niabella agricola TaxID=2891571 RepID=UPI001F284DAD|nr:RagB/SusD family nutrient uptake outer membrane protein [Niabella agricola]MCF3111673.1 RagB/SusD family nutrient uptake outer membrane protein [Niabella agricola]